jgi:hypothetical protein
LTFQKSKFWPAYLSIVPLLIGVFFSGEMRSAVMKANGQKQYSKKKVRPFAGQEFFAAMGLLVASAEYGQCGTSL